MMVLLERSQHLFREDLTELVMLAHKSNTHQHQWKAFYCHMFFEQAPTALENKIRPEVQNRQNMSRRMKTRIKIQVNGGKKKTNQNTTAKKNKNSVSNFHYLDTDASLKFKLQSDHVHFFHCAKLIELRDLFGHLINGYFNGVQLCAGLAYDLNTLLHIWKQVAGCSNARNTLERLG